MCGSTARVSSPPKTACLPALRVKPIGSHDRRESGLPSLRVKPIGSHEPGEWGMSIMGFCEVCPALQSSDEWERFWKTHL